MTKMYTYVHTSRNRIQHIGYDENGKKFIKTESFKPMIATITNEPQKHGFKTIKDDHVTFQQFDDINKFKTYTRDYGDILEIQNNIQPHYQFINRHYPDRTGFDTKNVRIFTFDIEAHSNKGEGFPKPEIAIWPLRSIAIHDSKTDNCFLLSLGKWETEREVLIERGVDLKKIQFKFCETEIKLFEYMVQIFQGCLPDILTGWNIDGFDIPYILNRASMIGFEDIKKLSPFNSTSIEWKTLDNGNIDFKCDIRGIQCLDYMSMYKKYTFSPRESYKLDHILEVEIGQKKVDFHDAGYVSFQDLWERNPDLYNSYNIYDTLGLVDLDKKLKLFDVHFSIVYKAGCNFSDAMGTIILWDVFMYNYLYKNKTVIPPKKHNTPEPFPGAYVKAPVVGVHKWIFSVDYSSLYPHLIQMLNVSPECIIEHENIMKECFYSETVNKKEHKSMMKDMKFDDSIIKDFIHVGDDDSEFMKIQSLHPDFLSGKIKGNRDYILAPNGVYFRKDKEGFVSVLMKELYAERKSVKKEMLTHEQELEDYKTNGGNDKYEITRLESLISSKDALQMGLKICLNSYYGAYGNAWFRYFDIRMSTAITLGGQIAQRWCDDYVIDKLGEKYGIRSIYGDTDSIYFQFDKVVEKLQQKQPHLKLNENRDELIDKCDMFINDVVIPVINESTELLREHINANENRLFMDREVIASSGCFIAKKKYYLNVCDNEGIRYHKDKFKSKGIALVQRTTPEICKAPMKECLVKMLGDHSELSRHILDFKKVFFTQEPHKIGQSKTANNIVKYESTSFPYYIGGTPSHVRGSINYNNFIEKNELMDDFETIVSGETVKQIYMKYPNPFASDENIFAFLGDRFPDAKNLSKYVDYETQFEKTFLKTVRDIAEKAGVELDLTGQILAENLDW